MSAPRLVERVLFESTVFSPHAPAIVVRVAVDVDDVSLHDVKPLKLFDKLALADLPQELKAAVFNVLLGQVGRKAARVARLSREWKQVTVEVLKGVRNAWWSGETPPLKLPDIEIEPWEPTKRSCEPHLQLAYFQAYDFKDIVSLKGNNWLTNWALVGMCFPLGLAKHVVSPLYKADRAEDGLAARQHSLPFVILCPQLWERRSCS